MRVNTAWKKNGSDCCHHKHSDSTWLKPRSLKKPSETTTHKGDSHGGSGAAPTFFLPVLCSRQAGLGPGLLICILLISMGKQGENWCHTAGLPSMKFPPRVYPLYPWIITMLLPVSWFLTRHQLRFVVLVFFFCWVKANKHTRYINHLASRRKFAHGQVVYKALHVTVTLGPCTPAADKVLHQSKGMILLWSHTRQAPSQVHLNVT